MKIENFTKKSLQDAIQEGKVKITVAESGDVLVEGAESDIDEYGMISIPENVVAIGVGAYEKSKALKAINSINDTCFIGVEAFYGCKNLESAFLMSKDTEGNAKRIIGQYAFANCTSLKRLFIDDSFVDLEEGVFENCESLDNVVLPTNLERIGDRAFAGCKHLQTIEIPDGVTEIGEEAFKGCKALQMAVIPEHLVEECNAKNVFKDCPRLQIVVKPEKMKEDMKVKTPVPEEKLNEKVLYAIKAKNDKQNLINHLNAETKLKSRNDEREKQNMDSFKEAASKLPEKTDKEALASIIKNNDIKDIPNEIIKKGKYDNIRTK